MVDGRHGTPTRLAAIAALMLIPGFAACVLARGGALELTCSVDADCDDVTVCTEDRCGSDGFCEFLPSDREEGLQQVPYDCKKRVCRRGLERELPDDADLSPDPCMDASCANGMLNASPKADGTACMLGEGSGTCQGGTCVVICGEDPSVCNDLNPCTEDSCDAIDEICRHETLDNVLSPEDDGVGDCRVDLCVAGVLQVDVIDDNDLPDDQNPCTIDGCNNGAATAAPAPEDTPCGANGTSPPVCDANGVCLDCDFPSDCPGTDTPCSKRTCENRVCGIQFEPDHTPCDDGLYCNGADECDNAGNCEHAGSPCQGPDNDNDCFESCDEANKSCTAHDGMAAPCNDDVFCNGADGCDLAGCNIHPGSPCPGPDGDSDCKESCKESNDSCTENDADASACDDGTFCNGADQCSGGNCDVHAGNPCPGPDGDGDCTESCSENNNNCSAYDGNGTACTCLSVFSGTCTMIGCNCF
jgi:hypothetical protein